jgi:hypothetical protein
MLDAFWVCERDDAGTVRHDSSIGEERENIARVIEALRNSLGWAPKLLWKSSLHLN